MQRRKKGMMLGLLGTVTGAMIMLGSNVMATNPVGLDIVVLSRGTFDAFKLKQHDFRITARGENDVVVGELTIAPGGDTGWHTHPGPTLATVRDGQVAVTILNKDGKCSTEVFSAGEGFSEGGGVVHIASTVGNTPAVLVVTLLAVEPGAPLPGAVIDWSPPVPPGQGCS